MCVGGGGSNAEVPSRTCDLLQILRTFQEVHLKGCQALIEEEEEEEPETNVINVVEATVS